MFGVGDGLLALVVIYVYVYKCMCVCVCMYIGDMYVYMSVYMRMCIYMCVRVSIHIYIHNMYVCVYVCIYVCLCMCVYIYVYVYVCIYIWILVICLYFRLWALLVPCSGVSVVDFDQINSGWVLVILMTRFLLTNNFFNWFIYFVVIFCSIRLFFIVNILILTII